MNKYRKFFMTAGMIFCLIGLNVNDVTFSADNEFTRPSLTDLSGVAVLVESLTSEMTREGLSKQMIESDVTSKLQEAGIQVLSEENGLWVAGTPYLYVNVNAFKSNEYVYYINLEFHQDAVLKRNSEIKVDAVTWSKRYIGASPHLNDIRSHTKDMIGIFINAFLSLNSQ